jgi:prepilin-type N-terminal cleavage/methylation domain-containing protein
MQTKSSAGFTLIELSIVLVVIGLIVGGVLVGQDLIRGAYVRAQISQIEKFNTAVNTFYGKYQAVPGDMNNTVATANGFRARGPYAGQGDGNGILEGSDTLNNAGYFETVGETVMFWEDLTFANGMNLNLIQGSFFTASPAAYTTMNPILLYPRSPLGENSVYVYSGSFGANGTNYYSIATFTSLVPSYRITPTPGLTVAQSYRIDQKIDDGLPQSGNVTATYVCSGTGYYSNVVWASGGSWLGGTGTLGGDPGTSINGSPVTCYDNGGNASKPTVYSNEQNGGAGMNCALSFKMQGGD